MALDYAEAGSGSHRIRRSRVLLIVAVAAALVAVPLLVRVSPGGLGRRVEELDIRSGRVRGYGEVLFWRSKPVVRESAISLALPPPAKAPQEWHIVKTFEGARRVHWAYGGAKSDMRNLDQLWQLVPFTPDAKRQVAREVLRLWQSEGDSSEAGRYVQAVAKVAYDAAEKRGTAVTAAELPPGSDPDAPASRPGKEIAPDGSGAGTVP